MEEIDKTEKTTIMDNLDGSGTSWLKIVGLWAAAGITGYAIGRLCSVLEKTLFENSPDEN